MLRVGKHGFELVPGARVDLPDDLRHQWNARVDELLDGLEPAELKAVELAAVLGHNVRGEIWSAARKRTGAELTEKLRMRLQQLSVARPLDDGDDWRFEHPMFREEITVRARKSRRLHRLHLACAKAMEDVDRGAAHLAEQRGRHLLMAGEPLAAAHVLLEAASAQIEEHQFEEATRILALRDETLRRLDLPADSPRPAESEVLRCRIMRLSGQDADAAALATKLTRLEDHAGCHEVIARALGELFEMKMADGRYKEGREAPSAGRAQGPEHH